MDTKTLKCVIMYILIACSGILLFAPQVFFEDYTPEVIASSDTNLKTGIAVVCLIGAYVLYTQTTDVPKIEKSD